MMNVILAGSLVVLHVGAQAYFIARALLYPNRQPSSRIAWVLIILSLPAFGFAFYYLFGETSIGRSRVAKSREVTQRLRNSVASDWLEMKKAEVELTYRHLFAAAQSINGFQPVDGNAARVMADSNQAIDSMVSDIDAAREHVHLLFYIWLPDNNGLKIAEAAKRAARRGVKVRAMADDIGSRMFIRSHHWSDMAAAGVETSRAYPLRNTLLLPFSGRVDLRNHRKIVVIDNQITYCGSQNCADPEFRVKAKYAPWVDIMIRFEGPVALQNQAIFLQDWMSHTDDDLGRLLRDEPADHAVGDVIGQVIGTGPTARPFAMPEMFAVMIHAARKDLTVTTPYYIPSEPIHTALCAAAHRGVDTRVVFPARNDSWVVAGASRSYYPDLVSAGVKVYEYPLGLLHAKTMTVDEQYALVGSSNLDRRSFDLNFENNILFQSRSLSADVREKQEEFIGASNRILKEHVDSWSRARRLWNNALATVGPVL